MKKHYFNLIYLAVAVLITGCAKVPTPPGPDQPEDPKTYFDYATSQTIRFNIQYDVPEGYKVSFEIYDQDPLEWKSDIMTFVKRSDIKPIGAGITDGKGMYSLDKVIPASVSQVYVYSPNFMVSPLMKGSVSGAIATPKEVDLVALAQKEIEKMGYFATKAGNATVYTTLGKWGSYGLPEYLDSNHKINIDLSVLATKINTILGKNKKAPNRFYRDATIRVDSDCEVWVTLVGGAANIPSPISYVCYSGSSLPSLSNMSDEFKNLEEIMLFPDMRFRKDVDPSETLKKGDAVQLMYRNPATGELQKTFPAGTHIIWCLRTNGVRQNGNEIQIKKDPLYWIYSNSKWNMEPNEKQHTVLFRTEGYVTIGIEDNPTETLEGKYKVGDRSFSDIVFVVSANPQTAISSPDGPIEELNKEEYAYIEEHYSGTLAYEDIWPYQGDYDMNDVVLSYQSSALIRATNTNTNDNGSVVSVKDIFKLKWSGAAYPNSFSYMMNTPSGNVKSIKINGIATDIDRSVSMATVVLFKNALVEIPSNKSAREYIIEMEFVTPIPVVDFNKKETHAPYNPFIYKDGGHNEIHLPYYTPTPANNNKLLGTGNDKSNPAKNIYYVNESNFPFAIHIVGYTEFLNTEEGKRIDEVYPDYGKWVASPSAYPQWYLNRK